MNIEEKARAYDKALKWMRELYPGLHGATKEDAEHYFPELRESEDERIRKELLDFVRSFWTDHKEKLPQTSRWVTYLEKQKEQKPALKQTLDAYKISDERATAKMEGRIEGRQDVINNPEEYGLQKPAEWSEEDEDMLNSCISSIEEAKENRYAYRETDGDTSYDHEISWLKSLRSRPKPSDNWKPNEEQMEALKCAIEDIARFSRRGGRQVELENAPFYSALHSLYCNLEKLM